MSGVLRLRLELFGSFRLTAPTGAVIEIAGRKNRLLLTILALCPGLAMTRDRVAGLLWGDHSEDQARNSLRQALAVLRKELGGQGGEILVSKDEVLVLDQGKVDIDVLEFLRLADSRHLASLRQALQLLRGELFQDVSVKEPGLEDWLSAERTRLKSLAIRVLDRLAGIERGEARIAVAQRLLALDNLREASHRALMLALAEMGETSLALKQFEACKTVLKNELAIEPAEETRELRGLIAQGSIVKSNDSGNEDTMLKVRPRVAVLPLIMIDPAQSQQYVGMGITEDIVTELSRYRTVATIAISSTARFGGEERDSRLISQQLNATHLVQGTIQIVGKKLKLTARLVEAETDTLLWSERYEENLALLPAVQAELAATLAMIVERRIATADVQKSKHKPISNWNAYDHFLRGRELSQRYLDREAIPHLEAATKLDPEHSASFAWKAIALVGQYFQDLDQELLDSALAAARQALLLDSHDAKAHEAMGLVRLWRKEHDLSVVHNEIGRGLNPGDTTMAYDRANLLNYVGRPVEALAILDSTRERDPFPPSWVFEIRAFMLFQLGRYADVIAEFDKMSVIYFWHHAWRAAAFANLGRMAEAQEEVARLLATKPGAHIPIVQKVLGFKSFDLCQPLLKGLELAGLDAGP